MAVLAGVDRSEAVAWVRLNYRPEAVETTEQERWVDWFAGTLSREASDRAAGRTTGRRSSPPQSP
jgi:hypothetical protein